MKTIDLVPSDLDALRWFQKTTHARVRSAASERIPSLEQVTMLRKRKLLTSASYGARLTSAALAALAAASGLEPIPDDAPPALRGLVKTFARAGVVAGVIRDRGVA